MTEEFEKIFKIGELFLLQQIQISIVEVNMLIYNDDSSKNPKILVTVISDLCMISHVIGHPLLEMDYIRLLDLKTFLVQAKYKDSLQKFSYATFTKSYSQKRFTYYYEFNLRTHT